VVGAEPLEAARKRHDSSRGELPIAALRISKGDPALPTVMLDEDHSSASHPYQRVVD
ncbi:MAG: nicotinate phosphoribosyltransferase, partial [Propionibacteriales bacterium]